MAVADYLHPTFSKKTLQSLKAERKVNRITFKPAEANPGETLVVDIPALRKNEVIVPGSLYLVFNIDLSGGHANNFLVQNVTRALVGKMVVKLGGTILEQNNGYNVYKTFEDLFLSQEKRDGMILEGIQSEDLCKIRSGSGDKKTSGVDTEKKLEEAFKKRYRIHLDHEILTENGVLYPHGLDNYLSYELTLAPAGVVVKGSDKTKVKYKLTNIELQYEMLESPLLAEEAEREYTVGKEFPFTHVYSHKIVKIKKDTDTLINIDIGVKRKSMKGILLLFKEPFEPGANDSEKFVFPDLNKVEVTIKSYPNKIYNHGIGTADMWDEAERFFVKENNKTEHMNLTKFHAGDRFGLIIDLRSMRKQEMHGSGERIESDKQGVQLEIHREAKGSGILNCHVFVISDTQLNIMNKQLVAFQI